MAMRTKGAALGTATNWIFNFMGKHYDTVLRPTQTNTPTSRRNYPSRHRIPPMALLHHLGRLQLLLYPNR
jgi:hypothetical protein